MSIAKFDLQGIVTNRLGRARSWFRFEKGKLGAARGRRLEFGFLLLAALVAAGCARTCVAQVKEVKVTGVAIGPDNVDACATGNVHFYVEWLAAKVGGNGHCCETRLDSLLSVRAARGQARCAGLPSGQFQWS